jgi:ABC-type cobalamin/Fe3+-siderophores transport system ATPase subunit
LISINIVIPDEFAFQCQEPVDPSRGRRMLDGINWTVYAGEHWAILGANGSGKTSLFKALTVCMAPTGGYRDSRLTRGHAFQIGFQRIGASWRKKKSAFVATQTTSRKAPAVTAEMMFLRLTSQRAFFFHHRRLNRVSVSPLVEPVALQ